MKAQEEATKAAKLFVLFDGLEERSSNYLRARESRDLLTRSFRSAYRNRVYVHIFLEMSVHICYGCLRYIV